MYRIEDYQATAGAFKHTSALASLLRHAGCIAPHNQQPWTEAMLLGLGGGLGAGYILWEFKAHHSAVLTLGFHHRWNDPQRWYTQALDRVGAAARWMQTDGSKRAAKALDAALRNGHPALCWVDEYHLPYLHVSEVFEGCFGWVVTVIAADADHVELDDVWAAPLQLERGGFDQARGRIGSYRHRQLTVQRGADCPDLRHAVRQGITDHVTYLGANSTSFGLGSLRKWGRTLADVDDAKGWPRLFSDGKRLASVFRSMREGIALRGMDGAGLRHLYGAFLREAGEALRDARLLQAAAAYAGLAERWRQLSSAPFPRAALADDDGSAPVPAGHPFAQGHPLAEATELTAMHRLLDEKFAALERGELSKAAAINAELTTLNQRLDQQPTWTIPQQNQLFRLLSEQVLALWFAEKQALAMLKAWLNEG